LRKDDNFNIVKKIQNRNKIYEALYNLTGGESIELRKVSVKEIVAFMEEQTIKENKEIENTIDEKYQNNEFDSNVKEEYIKKLKKKSLSKKTIEIFLKEDPRIEKDGSKYYLSDRKRFEYEFGLLSFDPREFGLGILDAILGSSRRIPMDERSDSYYKEELNDFVVKIGCFIIFAMIEAVKPLRYKKLHPREGEDLVYYWLNNIIPIYDIFLTFLFKFDEPKQSHNWKTPFSEINKSIIEQLMKTMKELYPDIYNRYIVGKRKNSGKNFENAI
jgi:hypothetical protein